MNRDGVNQFLIDRVFAGVGSGIPKAVEEVVDLGVQGRNSVEILH